MNFKDEIIAKAKTYQRKCEINARSHFLHWEESAKWNKRLGVPVVIATTFVGGTLFATITISNSLWLKVLLGLLSLYAAIMSSLQTMLKFSERSEKFKIAGLRYRSMVRRLDIFIFKCSENIYNKDTQQIALQEFENIALNLDEIAMESPSISDKMYDKAISEISL